MLVDPWDPGPPPSSWPQSDPKLWARDGGTLDTHGRCMIPVWRAARHGERDPRWEPCLRLSESTHHRNHHHTDNRPSNRLTVCGDGVAGHHGWIENHPEVARRYGWSITRHGPSTRFAVPVPVPEPADVPVFLWHPAWGLNWFLLTDDYGITPTAPPEGASPPPP